ncbi:MAG TPA: hypothetical protein DCE41_32865 [Cytophagales bacterium]|nr:hypothetical protein [Cytophagales bacterium]HAA17311.1 hypothetical protein [Cytophagales bacterium]HAP62973.1 hypothetical protein [Cytophagales bacterium]
MTDSILKQAFRATAFLLLLGARFPMCLAQVPESDSVYHQRMALVVKLWGHVKYYHPHVADGTHNWDQTLISYQPALKNAESADEFNSVLLAMFTEVGDVPEADGTRPTVPDSLNNNLDLSWIQDPMLSGEVSQYLEKVWEEARPRPHVQVDDQWTGNPTLFAADARFAGSPSYPIEPQRFLAVARYWNVIHYFFPYKDLMDQTWETSLDMAIPEVLGAANALEYHLALLRLVNSIDDTHSYFNSEIYWNWRGWAYPPFLARFVENQLVVTRTILNLGSVSVGDIILSIDGKTVEEWIEELWPYAHGSNEEARLSVIAELIIRRNPGAFSAILSDGTREYTVDLERLGTYSEMLFLPENGPYWVEQVGGCRVGRIDMALLETGQINTMFNELNRMDVLVFDIRNYPQGTLWELVNYLYPGPIHIATFEIPNLRFPGHFSMGEEEIGQGTTSPWDGNLIILFDEQTISQAEYTIMGLEQFPGALKVGSTTAAADGNLAWVYLPGGIEAAATFLGVFYPDFTPTQRVGIQPDIYVKPTVEGIRAGRDEVLEAAYEAIDISQCLSTSIPGTIDPYSISLYPNPAVDRVGFQLPEAFSGEKVTVQLVDGQGKEVLSKETDELNGNLDISSLSRGMYVLRFQGGGHQAERLLFKE